MSDWQLRVTTNIILLSIACIILLITSSVTISKPNVHLLVGTVPVALSPETAVRDALNNRGVIQGFQFHSKKFLLNSVLLTYSYTLVTPRNVPRIEFGYAITKFNSGGWNVTDLSLQGLPLDESPIAYASYDLGDHFLIDGYIIDDRVVTVEIIFDTGKTISIPHMTNRFSVIEKNVHSIREIIVYGQANKVLTRYTDSKNVGFIQ